MTLVPLKSIQNGNFSSMIFLAATHKYATRTYFFVDCDSLSSSIVAISCMVSIACRSFGRFRHSKFLKFFEIHKTFAVFGCPKVACSRDGARDFFCYSQVNNVLSPLHADVRETVKFCQSHVIRSPPIKHMKRRKLTIGIHNESIYTHGVFKTPCKRNSIT